MHPPIGSHLRRGVAHSVAVACLVFVAHALHAAPATRPAEVPEAAPAGLPGAGDLTFAQSANKVDCYDTIELTIQRPHPPAINPFTQVSVTGRFTAEGVAPATVEGFCDSDDGSLFRIRFMPSKPRAYSFAATFRDGAFSKEFTGIFRAAQGKRRGIVRVDARHPWHFVWEGTGEHYFLNGTTAFLLMGWDDEKVIAAAIDRLHALDVNRLRVLLNGRSDHFWTEPVKPTDAFRAALNRSARPAARRINFLISLSVQGHTDLPAL